MSFEHSGKGLERAKEHILELAADLDMSDEEAVSAMLAELNAQRDSLLIKDMVMVLDPSTHYAETRSLTETAKDRLNQALESFVS